MTATVHSLEGQRRKHLPKSCCPCSPADGFVCYPHRLVDVLVKVEDVQADVERFQFCDVALFDRLAESVRDVLGEIVGECLPEEREIR